MALPRSWGGLDMGRGLVSLILTVMIVGFVAYLATTQEDVEEPAARTAATDPVTRNDADRPAAAPRRSVLAPKGRHAGGRDSR
jgi:hypothetical protein